MLCRLLLFVPKNELGMKGKLIGLIPSGPGDFFALKPVNALLTLSLFNQSFYLPINSVSLITLLLS